MGYTCPDAVVLIVTGSGFKDVDSAFKATGMPETIDPDPEQIMAAVKSEILANMSHELRTPLVLLSH